MGLTAALEAHLAQLAARRETTHYLAVARALAEAPAPRPGDPTRAPPGAASDTCAAPSQDPVLRARHLRWAALLRRVFGIEVFKCARCGGQRKIVAFITKPAELKRLCAHLGYPTEPPPIAPARATPQPDLWDQRTEA